MPINVSECSAHIGDNNRARVLKLRRVRDLYIEESKAISGDWFPHHLAASGLTLGTPLFSFPLDYQQQYNSLVQTFSLFKPSSNPIPSRQKEACLMFFSYLISMSRISVLRLSRRSELSFGVFLFFRRGPVDQSPNWLGPVNLCCFLMQCVRAATWAWL